MKEFYTQKDICRLLNITRETLRYYEKEGLIHPLINETNQYRFYDDYQMYLVSECKRYQTNGFSIQQIRTMMKEDTLEQYTDRIREAKDETERKAEVLLKQLNLMCEYHAKLQRIPEELNIPSLSSFEEILFAPQKTGRELLLDEESLAAGRFMIERMPLTFMMFMQREDTPLWGCGVYARYAAQEDTNGLALVRIHESKAVRMTVDTGNEWDFTLRQKEDMTAYAKENALVPCGDFFMIQLVKTGEEKDMHRYFEAYLPVG